MIKLLIAIVGGGLLLLSGCKKYEEGPKVSFRSAENVIPGNWRIQAYTVNGADSMWVIEGLHLQGNFRFNHYATYASPDLSITTMDNDTSYYYSGTWSIDDKGKDVYLNVTTLYINGDPRFRNPQPSLKQMPIKNLEWQVSRLKHKEDMWLKIEEGGKQYELKFKAI